MRTPDLLAQGITAARAGRKDEAQATLLKVLEADDRSELAWLWLSGIFESPSERRICLENVLAINPANSHARRGLELLDRAGPPPAQPVPPPPPPAEVAPQPAPAPAQTLWLPRGDGDGEASAPAAAPAQTLRLPRGDGDGEASAPAAAPAQTLRLPRGDGEASAPAAVPMTPATTDTIELPRPPAPDPAPERRSWWRPRKAEAPAAQATVAPPAPPPAPPAPAPVTLAPAEPPEASIKLPEVATMAGNAEEPCPYCGATTFVSQNRCPTCRKSLMASGVRRADRSLPLKILVVCYGLMTLSNLGSGMLQVAGLSAMGGAAAGEGGAGWLPALAVAVGVLIGTALYAGFTLALWQRKVWAYVLHWVGVISNLLGVVILAVFLVMMGSALPELLAGMPEDQLGPASGLIGALAGALGMLALCGAVVSVLWLALTVACHGDFFGRKVRLSTAGIATEGDAYNVGIAYRKRGMWYMAAHAWELAARSSPRDATVRRALGLAYAQLGRFEQARDELSVALALLPGNPQLSDDLRLVERMAANKR